MGQAGRACQRENKGRESATVETRDDLVRWIAAGEKPRSEWRIGTEHEKFVFRTGSLAPVSYDGPDGIRALMEELIRRYGWIAIREGDNVIALRRPDGEKGGTISLEPGGQFELSGAPLETLHETAAETDEHLREVIDVGEDLAIGFLGIGFSPKWRLDEVPRMPKKRYQVMTRYMPTVGSRGLDMMYRTATVQVNLDYGSEADMVKKLRVSLALQPIATALFASSPFTEGKPNGFQSMRSEVWRDTDKRRTGMLPFVFEPGMGYERYVEYALDVPMYFVYRGGNYIDVAGASFRDFLDGRLQGLRRRTADRRRLVRSSDNAFPRSSPQAVPRNARRRRRSMGNDYGVAGLLDRHSLRRDGARPGLGDGARLDRRRARPAAERRAEVGVRDALPLDERSRPRSAGPSYLAAGAQESRTPQFAKAGRNGLSGAARADFG